MWSSQSPEPGALSLFIGGLGSVPCEGLAPRPNPWQKEASQAMAFCFWVVVPGNGVLWKALEHGLLVAYVEERRVSLELRNVMPF